MNQIQQLQSTQKDAEILAQFVWGDETEDPLLDKLGAILYAHLAEGANQEAEEAIRLLTELSENVFQALRATAEKSMWELNKMKS